MKGKTALLLLFIGKNLFAQGLSHQVVLPWAGVVYKEGISYSHTLGETAVELFSSTDHVLTQGFQQPRLKMLPGDPPKGNGVNAYPNPSRDYLYIEFFGEDPRSFRITMSTISGTLVYSREIGFNEKYWYIHEIQVAGFSTGLYFVQVVSSDGKLRRSYKIEKI